MTKTYAISQVGGKRVRSKKTGKLGAMRKIRHIVHMKDDSIRGFGSTKIVANVATHKEAQDFIAAQKGK